MEAEHEIVNIGPRQAPSNLWVDALHHLLEKRSAVVGLIMLGALVLIAILAPVLATSDPIQIIQDAKRNTPPCIHFLGCPESQAQHFFGIDGNSRDFFSRVLYGARLSLVIGYCDDLLLHWHRNTAGGGIRLYGGVAG